MGILRRLREWREDKNGTLIGPDIDADSVKTDEVDVTNETLVVAITDQQVSGVASNTYESPSFGTIVKDERGEFSSDTFTPDQNGFYYITANARSRGGVTDGDNLRGKLRNTSDNSDIFTTPRLPVGNADGFATFGPTLSTIAELEAGKSYQYVVTNEDSSYDIDSVNGRIAIRRWFR